MGIKESIANLRKALRTTQTNAPAVIDTLIRGLDGVETAIEDESTYSTDEKIVGKWIDESTVYEKTINFGTLPNNTVKEYSLDNNMQVVGFEGVGISPAYVIPLPYIYPDEGGIIALYTAGNKLRITTNSDRTAFTGYITIRYIKTGDNRSPENDTKNDGDEEKNTDER